MKYINTSSCTSNDQIMVYSEVIYREMGLTYVTLDREMISKKINHENENIIRNTTRFAPDQHWWFSIILHREMGFIPNSCSCLFCPTGGCFILTLKL